VPELVIFDCDGVLVDSEPLSNQVLNRHLAAVGLPLSLEESAARFTGRSMASCVRLIEQSLGAALPSDFVAAVREDTRAAFEGRLEAVQGVHEVLAALARPFCVASSGSHAKIRHSLGLTGLARFFDDARIFSAEDVARGKPAPDLFLLAAARCGAPAGACVVVEDSRPGVEAAVAAGMPVLGFAARTGPRNLEAAGATVFNRMDQLAALL